MNVNKDEYDYLTEHNKTTVRIEQWTFCIEFVGLQKEQITPNILTNLYQFISLIYILVLIL